MTAANQTSSQKILRVDGSMRREGSATRQLTDELVARLGGETTVRDLAEGVPFVDADWITANFTHPDERTEEQRATLTPSDGLVGEIQNADVIVIGLPIYNFSVPAAVKAWIDQIARVHLTFRYSETGPIGLLEGKKAYVVVASGGTEVGSPIDFATGYIRHALGFIGVDDVEIIDAGAQMAGGDAAMERARAQLVEAA